MAIENEVKIRVDELDQLRDTLRRLNPRVVAARHLEDNYSLDFPDGRIRARGCLLRVRITRDTALLTFKEAARAGGLFNTREELETPLQDGRTVLEILRRVGLQVWFHYQKYREEFSITPGSKAGNEVHVALDETPVGTFVELEGPEDPVRKVAGKLGFSEAQFMRDSYYALYIRFCQERGQEPRHMIFG